MSVLNEPPVDAQTERASGNTVANVLIRGAWSVLRWTLYGVLSLLRPVLIPVLTGVAAGGVLLWAVFVLAGHDTAFPSLQVLGTSVACALTAVLYQAIIELLAPGSLPSR